MSRNGTQPALQSKVRCAIYTRKSTEEGLDQEFNSLDAQRESAEAYIASQKNEGWVCLPDRYDDGGFSGGNIERPAIQRLLADIAAGNIDCVIVYKVDRLSRSLMDFARVMESFERYGISFVSVTQAFNTTHSMGRLTLNILLSFAQFEREIIGERIRDKIAAQRRKGKWVGGVPMLGYEVDRSTPTPKLTVNVKEAQQVREMFQLYLRLGSLLAVVEEVNRRGWFGKHWTTKKGLPKGGRPYDKCSVHALLTNPIYAGKIKYKTELHQGEHEAIVVPELFQKVQDQLQYHGRSGGIVVRNRYGALLRGLLVCGACGRAMVHTFTGKTHKMYRYYTCTTAIKRGRAKCPTGSLPAAEIERFILDQIRGMANDKALRGEVLRQAQAGVDQQLADFRGDRARLERELVRHHAEIRRLATTESNSSAATERIADLHQKISTAEPRLLELEKQIEDLTNGRVDDADVDRAFADFDALWKTLTIREQVKLIRLLVARVEINADDGTVSVTYHPSGIQALAEERVESAA